MKVPIVMFLRCGSSAWLMLVLPLCTVACPYIDRVINLSGLLKSNISHLKQSDLQNCALDAKGVDLTSNGLLSIANDTFDRFWNFETINLSDNLLTSLPAGLLKNLRTLRHFDASYNSLTTLEDDLFFQPNGVPLVNLVSIDFASNNISTIGFNVFHEDMASLLLVNLSFNSITEFEPWPYVPQTDQSDDDDVEWDFRFNKISKFSNNMNWTYNLVEAYEHKVYLQNNELSSFSDDMIYMYHPDYRGDPLGEFSTYEINVTNNPFICDCKPYQFVKSLHGSLFLYYQVDRFRITCNEPSQHKGVDFMHDMPLDEFVCNITESCPVGCFCQERPDSYDLYVDCTNANLYDLPVSLPRATYGNISLHLDGNNIVDIKETNYSSDIRNLTISNNRLNFIASETIKAMSNLKYLDVHNNRLQYIPKQLQLLDFYNISLSQNPLVCACNMTWMTEWISLSPNAKDSQITCDYDGDNLKISEITEEQLLCNFDKLIIIISVTLGIVIAIVLGISITAKRCPYETKVLLYRLFGIHPQDKYRVDYQPDKEHDIYITYYQGEEGESVQVRQWINKVFLKKMEEKSKRKYSVFCFERDYRAGEFKVDEIADNMRKSRRIILILSPAFLEDDWCAFEADQAEYEHNSNESIHGRVIYILWNEGIKETLQEPWISRLKGKRIMCPDDRFFWSKMRYELPVKTLRTFNKNSTMPFVMPKSDDKWLK